VPEDEQLTREQAEACLKIVQDWIAIRGGKQWLGHLKLYEPGFHCGGWAIALEGGPEEWPWYISQDKSITWPEGAFVEAGATWYLGLHGGHNC